jgi:hypothetical protein
MKTDHIAIFSYPESTRCVKEIRNYDIGLEQSIRIPNGVIKN